MDCDVECVCSSTLETQVLIYYSSDGREFKETITELVDLALKLAEVEKVWIGMAIAQRSHAKASIEASIRQAHSFPSCIVGSDSPPASEGNVGLPWICFNYILSL